jgi:tetratricopeptide (TPR) repeat protein
MTSTSLRDFRGDPITGATADALEAFEQGLAGFRSWRGDPVWDAGAALELAPGFVMAHVLHAYVLLCTRDPASVRAAAPVYTRAAALPANRREQLHLAAIRACLRDDYDGARSIFAQLLAAYPRDVLALQVAHAFDYLSGETALLLDRVATVADAWSPELPGYHAVLAMLAFGLAEAGDSARAEAVALEALALEPLDARAHHALAHAFEMAGRPEDGLRWMSDRSAAWAGNTFVATHCRWHMALYHLALGEVDGALRLYDDHIGGRDPRTVADLIDASSLLWRVALQGGNVSRRWTALATGWSPHLADGFCTFNDLHAMMAFVGAQDWRLVGGLLRELGRHQQRATRYGTTTRLIGMRAARALLAFGVGDDPGAIRLMAELPAVADRMGGSHAQRSVLDLTLRAAQARVSGRPALHLLAA